MNPSLATTLQLDGRGQSMIFSKRLPVLMPSERRLHRRADRPQGGAGLQLLSTRRHAPTMKAHVLLSPWLKEEAALASRGIMRFPTKCSACLRLQCSALCCRGPETVWQRQCLAQGAGADISLALIPTSWCAVPFEEDDRDPRIWFLDHSYMESMCAMFKKVNGEHSYCSLLPRP